MVSYYSSGSGGCRGGHGPPPGPVKLVIEKMAAEGSHIDFMFLGPHPTAGSATVNKMGS